MGGQDFVATRNGAGMYGVAPTSLIALLIYGAAFTALRHFSSAWHTGELFSLWFPAAGLRFAFLWRFGARFAPGAALAEAVVQLATGMNSLQPHPLISALGIVGPCLAYGLVIHLLRTRVSGRAPVLGAEPLPFALAAMIAPPVACLTALLWGLPRVLQGGSIDPQELLKSMLVFAMGDTLGVILVAPPLLWLTDRLLRRKSWRFEPPRKTVLLEVGTVVLLAWLLIWSLRATGLGLMLAPVLLATCWAGLRIGRGGAWLVILLTAAVCLPLTGQEPIEAERLRVHMLLVCVAAIGFLAGSFAEAETRSRREMARRDRLLYHAERLKTLRGMSVALIHEISQPLSTIAIEARTLNGLSASSTGSHQQISDGLRLIATKSEDLSRLVRRLRQFGERRAENSSTVSLHSLVQDLKLLATPEASAAKVRLGFKSAEDKLVTGNELELRQALLNLLRNAISASPEGAEVTLNAQVDGDRALLAVENECASRVAESPGMGVGLIIVRSIAEAHSGSLRTEYLPPNRVRYTIDLPVVEMIDA